MGRHRGPKFSFPIPGRWSHTKVDTSEGDPRPAPSPSIPSIPSEPEWSPRLEEPSSYSKAERLLGTAGLPFRPSSRQAPIPSPAPSPGYMTITVSEASFGSDLDDRTSSAPFEEANLHPGRPSMLHRASSNILGNAFSLDGRRGSNGSSSSRRLHAANSDSTMRSHYDAEGSPLAISQQTSNSAVRDMALRKGKPRVLSMYGYDVRVPSPLAGDMSVGTKKEQRKSKPPRLDLSKLFPKPKASGGQGHAATLLSPTKLVNSPTAMSISSDFNFPRPMTREPTPTPRGQAKLTKTAKRQQTSSAEPPRSSSPVRLHQRDTYDSAKINVRRPPRGIQHWFEGLDDESDDMSEEEQPPIHAPRPIKPNGAPVAPLRKSSLGRLLQGTTPPQRTHYTPTADRKVDHRAPKKESLGHAHPSAPHSNSPTQFSMQSQTSLASSKTRESAFSKRNLQDSSVLSFSSSEDEDESASSSVGKVPVRESLDLVDHGEVIMGQAQAFEVRPRIARRTSAGKSSLLSTSTNAATIEVMYTPEPYAPQYFPRGHVSSSKRPSAHVRPPPVILENENPRPKTSTNRPKSPSSTSARSARTSASEPRTLHDTRKLMAVTEEEEALLEMMRRKRASMVKQSFTEGYQTAVLLEGRQEALSEAPKKSHRTSAFLSTESLAGSPARVANTKSSRKSYAGSASALLVLPSRGRTTSSDTNTGTSVLRDSSSCDTRSDLLASPSSRISFAHQLSPPPEFSPLDPFPSPFQTASIASPTTPDHPSPLPSPITPGLRHPDVDVKVASSESSSTGDNDEVAVLETGVIGPPSGSIKTDESCSSGTHQRRRTASSGAEISAFPMPKGMETQEFRDLTSLSEASSHAASYVESSQPLPKLPRKSSRRKMSLTVSTNFPAPPKSRQSSISTFITSPVPASQDRRSSRIVSRGSSINSIKRDSIALGSASTRCSVSEDVLAAWGSLGGLRDYGTGRYY